MVTTKSSPLTKHRRVYDALRQEIESGRLKSGDRLPTEADLVRMFRVSRITAGRAVRDLQVAGVVERRAGSGTYVKAPPVAEGLSFGLLIPDLGETDVFEPICQGMMASPLATGHGLLWGSAANPAASKEDRAWELCRRFIDRRVSGVFFAPLEWTIRKDDVNRRIVTVLDGAGIPVVLLDRPALPYPTAAITISWGSTIACGPSDRESPAAHGRAACRLRRRTTRAPRWRRGKRATAKTCTLDAPIERALTARLDPTDAVAVRAFLTEARPDGIVCANDWTAARFMRTALALGFSVPGDLRVAGIDDMDYASLLPVPLTTLRQPTREIGAAALAAMLDRVARPDQPARDILLQTELIVRRSCGAPGDA